jgi:hypothetical protein
LIVPRRFHSPARASTPVDVFEAERVGKYMIRLLQFFVRFDNRRHCNLSSPTMGWGKIGAVNAHLARMPENEIPIFSRKGQCRRLWSKGR